MEIKLFIGLAIIGLLAGFLSGTLGVGGGVIMVPLIAYVLAVGQHGAQGTSLAVLAVPVTALAAYNYYQEGYVNWKYSLLIAAFFIVGGYFGSKLAVNIPQATLRKIFGVVMIIIAIKMIFFTKTKLAG